MKAIPIAWSCHTFILPESAPAQSLPLHLTTLTLIHLPRPSSQILTPPCTACCTHCPLLPDLVPHHHQKSSLSLTLISTAPVSHLSPGSDQIKVSVPTTGFPAPGGQWRTGRLLTGTWQLTLTTHIEDTMHPQHCTFISSSLYIGQCFLLLLTSIINDFQVLHSLNHCPCLGSDQDGSQLGYSFLYHWAMAIPLFILTPFLTPWPHRSQDHFQSGNLELQEKAFFPYTHALPLSLSLPGFNLPLPFSNFSLNSGRLPSDQFPHHLFPPRLMIGGGGWWWCGFNSISSAPTFLSLLPYLSNSIMSCSGFLALFIVNIVWSTYLFFLICLPGTLSDLFLNQMLTRNPKLGMAGRGFPIFPFSSLFLLQFYHVCDGDRYHHHHPAHLVIGFVLAGWMDKIGIIWPSIIIHTFWRISVHLLTATRSVLTFIYYNVSIVYSPSTSFPRYSYLKKQWLSFEILSF